MGFHDNKRIGASLFNQLLREVPERVGKQVDRAPEEARASGNPARRFEESMPVDRDKILRAAEKVVRHVVSGSAQFPETVGQLVDAIHAVTGESFGYIYDSVRGEGVDREWLPNAQGMIKTALDDAAKEIAHGKFGGRQLA